ncbi:RNA-directed RNA polymerase [Dirofilaria immitis]
MRLQFALFIAVSCVLHRSTSQTFLANAFAVVRLATVQEFHLSRSDTNAPVRPS